MKWQAYVLILVSISLVSCTNSADNASSVRLPVDANAVYPFHVVESGYVGFMPSATNTKLDPEFETKFDRIGPGECAAVAYAQLGTPVIQGADIPSELKLNNNFGGEYDAHIQQYLVWQNSDNYYCLGFTGTAEVVLKYKGSLTRN